MAGYGIRPRPVVGFRQRQGGLPDRQHRLGGLFVIAVLAECLDKIVDFDVRRCRRPRVGGEIFEQQRVGVGNLWPVDKSFAHRIFHGHGEVAFDDVVVAAHFRMGLVGVEDAEHPRELAEKAPVLEIVQFVVRVGRVVENDRVGGIELRDEFADLLGPPMHAEIP